MTNEQIKASLKLFKSYLPNCTEELDVCKDVNEFKEDMLKKGLIFVTKETEDIPSSVVEEALQLYGVKEEVEYDITIETKKTATIPYTTQYINDSSLPVGTQKVEQNGSNGSKYEAYKVMKLNGEVVSRTLLSKDTYNAKKKIVRIGTKQ